MAAIYPTGLVTFTVKENKVDLVDASHVNRLQEEIIAMQTAIGTNPRGSCADFNTRVGVLIDSNGAIWGSNAYPGTPVAKQLVFRTDTGLLYIRDAGNTTWSAVGSSVGNCLFQYCGLAKAQKEYVGNSLVSGTGLIGINYRYLYAANAGAEVFQTVWNTQWKKISGINTITVAGELWGREGGTGAVAKIDIGYAGTFATFYNSVPSVPGWANVNIDVSGLANGTLYDVIASLAASGGSANVCLSNIIAFGS